MSAVIANRIALSMHPHLRQSALVIRMNIRNASAAPTNHRERERRPARAENKVQLMNTAVSVSETTRVSKLLESARRRRLLTGGNSG
jgi:hypothetical protein